MTMFAVMILRGPAEGTRRNDDPASEDPARVRLALYNTERRALTELARAAYGCAENYLLGVDETCREAQRIVNLATVRLPSGRQPHRRSVDEARAAVTDAYADWYGEFWRGWVERVEVQD